MRGQFTTSRKFYPVRIQRKYLRTVRGKKRYKSASCVPDSVSINLNDLGDVGVKELNTIPSSISEDISWGERADEETEERLPCPNPLLQVNSGKFCTVCTAELVKIHGNDSCSDTCIHVEQTEYEALARARSFFEQNVMNLLNGLDKKNLEQRILQVITSKDRDETICLKTQENKKSPSKRLIAENQITCSMSKLSMQACLSTTDSTISAVISEAVQTPPSLFVWPSSSDERMFSQGTEDSKLKLLCGEILLQLCKATAGNMLKGEATERTVTATVKNPAGGKKMFPDDEKQVGQNKAAIGQQFPKWWQGLTRESSQSRTGIHQKNDLPIQGGTGMKLKVPSKTFKPLLCTKLSLPWRGRKHSSHSMSVRPHPKYSAALAKSVSTLMATVNSKSRVTTDEPQPMKICSRTESRTRNWKPKEEGVKRMNKGLREHALCAKCRNSLRSTHHNNLTTIKAKPTKGRMERAHKRRHRTSKEIRTRRHHSIKRREAVPKNSDTKYFIKSFFTGTSSETTQKSKSNDKMSMNLLAKPYNRRKKSTFTLPHDVTVGQAGVNLTKKKPGDASHVKQPPLKIKSKDDADLLMSKELKMISKHVKAHKKHNNESSTPMFHTCFKHILSRELKNKGVHVRKPQSHQKESSHHKKTKGAGIISSSPQRWEKRKFNDSLFSCLIPRVFKFN